MTKEDFTATLLMLGFEKHLNMDNVVLRGYDDHFYIYDNEFRVSPYKFGTTPPVRISSDAGMMNEELFDSPQLAMNAIIDLLEIYNGNN